MSALCHASASVTLPTLPPERATTGLNHAISLWYATCSQTVNMSKVREILTSSIFNVNHVTATYSQQIPLSLLWLVDRSPSYATYVFTAPRKPRRILLPFKLQLLPHSRKKAKSVDIIDGELSSRLIWNTLLRLPAFQHQMMKVMILKSIVCLKL